MTTNAPPKPKAATTTKNELKQIIKGILLEMISDGTLPAAMKTYETLTEGAKPVYQQHIRPAQSHPGFISEQQRAAMNANAVFGADPAMADIFADTLANAPGAMLEEQSRLDAMLAHQQRQAPVPEMGAAFPRNMMPPRDEAAVSMLNEQQNIIPGAPASNRWAELAFSKSSLPKPNQPGFLPGKR